MLPFGALKASPLFELFLMIVLVGDLMIILPGKAVKLESFSWIAGAHAIIILFRSTNIQSKMNYQRESSSSLQKAWELNIHFSRQPQQKSLSYSP